MGSLVGVMQMRKSLMSPQDVLFTVVDAKYQKTILPPVCEGRGLVVPGVRLMKAVWCEAPIAVEQGWGVGGKGCITTTVDDFNIRPLTLLFLLFTILSNLITLLVLICTEEFSVCSITINCYGIVIKFIKCNLCHLSLLLWSTQIGS